MVMDFVSRFEHAGLSEADLLSLLGPPSSKARSVLSYIVGYERGLGPSMIYMHVYLGEDGRVTRLSLTS